MNEDSWYAGKSGSFELPELRGRKFFPYKGFKYWIPVLVIHQIAFLKLDFQKRDTLIIRDQEK
jgi:hypothetical protein